MTTLSDEERSSSSAQHKLHAKQRFHAKGTPGEKKCGFSILRKVEQLSGKVVEKTRRIKPDEFAVSRSSHLGFASISRIGERSQNGLGLGLPLWGYLPAGANSREQLFLHPPLRSSQYNNQPSHFLRGAANPTANAFKTNAPRPNRTTQCASHPAEQHRTSHTLSGLQEVLKPNPFISFFQY